MKLIDNLDIYDNIENSATKDIFFNKFIYPYYLYLIYRYAKSDNYYPNEDLKGYVLMKLIMFQMNRKKYKVKDISGYLNKIVINAINDYHKKENYYKNHYILRNDFDN